MIFKQKPSYVEAHQLTDKNLRALEAWCGGSLSAISPSSLDSSRSQGLVVPTPMGVRHASVGDFVVKGPAGRFFVCSAQAFREQYDPCLEDLCASAT